MFLFVPIGTTRPCWRAPVVTWAIILLNFIVFCVQIALGADMPEGFVPAHPNPLMWLLSTFMHGGFLHLAGNMLFLWLFATIVEDILGPRLLLGFYFAANLGASLLHAAMGALGSPAALEIPVVGASGAIAGIMGLSSVCFLKAKVKIWYLVGIMYIWRAGVFEVGAPFFLGLWVGWEVVQGLVLTAVQAHTDVAVGGIAHWAHVGGFAAGIGGAIMLGLGERVARTDALEGRVASSHEYGMYEQRGDLEQMVQKRPDDAELWFALAQARADSMSEEAAKKAYGTALELCLRHGIPDKAVAAWRALSDGQRPPMLEPELRFAMAGAFDDCGHKEDAFGIYRELALDGGSGPRTETSLVRAGELALALPTRRAEAAPFFQRIVRDFPYGAWGDLAKDRLRELGVDSNQVPEETHEPTAATPTPAAFDDLPEDLLDHDPYGMGVASVSGDREGP
jgi:membrane associated rhomboid family serine protease